LKIEDFDGSLGLGQVMQLTLKIKAFLKSKILILIGISSLIFLISPRNLLNAQDSSNLPDQKSEKKQKLGPYELGPKLTGQEKTSANATLFHFDQNDWNDMRKTIEEGREPGQEFEEVAVASAPATPPKPPQGQISFELPYESSLAITGRKVITLQIENKHISQERAQELGTAQDVQSFNLEQQLQARIQGTVARKTTINVNFDDTKENVRDFSVVYTGDPDEVVQEAAFGDIALRLPETQFVNYNKQLFGISTKLKYKRAGFQAIGSRTKGNTETKRFTGTTERFQVYINDVDYLRRKYYDLTFSSSSPPAVNPKGIRAILPSAMLPLGNAPEFVLAEDNLSPLATFYAVTSPTDTTKTELIQMRQLSPGIDYSIDRIKGIITFTNQRSENERIAIDFTFNNGARLTSLTPAINDVAVLIKDRVPETPEVSQELKLFYSIGAQKIVYDNGLGNFVLKVQDKNRTSDIGNTLSPIQAYPDTIHMNFEQGIFELDKPLPFPEVYTSNTPTGSPQRAVFFAEYQAIKRTFNLAPNIVLQSETVEVNGRKLNRDLDYFIDYDLGILTFFNADLIRESSVIEVTYEFAPFGGQLGETLVGGRGTYDILNKEELGGLNFQKWSVGSSAIYNFAAKPPAPPDVRSVPSSLLVTEGDTNVEALKWWSLPVTTNLQMEAAQSRKDPNLFGTALIDSMEGIKQEDSASMLRDSWLIASNPASLIYNPVSFFTGRDVGDSHLRWDEINLPVRDPNSNGASEKALHVTFDLKTSTEQASIIQVLSQGGRDFSKKLTLEVEIWGAGTPTANNTKLIVDYGSFSEDTDQDGNLDTEDTVIPDGILNLGEDGGWLFNGSIRPVRVGANNGLLDSEDLNGDKILETQDLPATFLPLFQIDQDHPQTGLTDTGGTVTVTDLRFSGRLLFQIPLDIKHRTQDEVNRLSAVKQVRLTVRNDGKPRSGTFSISRLAVVGNTWEPATIFLDTSLSTMTVRAINTKDNVPPYDFLINSNPDYAALYKGSKPPAETKEQSLSLDFLDGGGILAESSATTRNVYGTPRDFSTHEFFKFFIRKNPTAPACSGNCGKFYLQAGSETQYEQATINISDIPSDNWMVVTIHQTDTNRDEQPDTWVAEDPKRVAISIVGVPNLSQISQIKLGIVNNTATPIQNDIWVNEIHLSESNVRVGNARAYKFDTTWQGWMNFGGNYRSVDRNFQTPTTAVTNQDNKQTSAFISLTRLSFLPMDFTTSKRETVTPSAFQSNSNGLVSVLEEGRMTDQSNTFNAKLVVPKLPLFDFNFKNGDAFNNLIQRRDLTQDWNLTGTYSPQLDLDLLPGPLTFKPLPTNIRVLHHENYQKVRYTGAENLVAFGRSTAPFDSTNITQTTQESEFRLDFQPWSGFTFNPLYRVSEDKQRFSFREDELESAPQTRLLNDIDAPKRLSQTVSVDGGLKIFQWLNPRYKYSITGTENNNQPTLNNTTAYTLKSISRNGVGELSDSIQIAQLLPRFKPTQSLTFNLNYKLDNRDAYENVPKDFKWRDKLYVGNALNFPTSTTTANGLTQARRTMFGEVRTFNSNASWLPFSAYKLVQPKLKPLSTLNLTSVYQKTIDESETTGTFAHIDSTSWPDLIVSLNDSEDFFGEQTVLDESRLTVKTNTLKKETRDISTERTDTLGSDYHFKFIRKLDFDTGFNTRFARSMNLATQRLNSKSKSKGYSVQTSIPMKSWRFTPRYSRNQTDEWDSVKQTNDLVAEDYSLQIYGDLTKPLGVRFGRYEYGLQNRMILNSTIKWEKKRSAINPETNYLDTYSANASGDYTISQNFRLAIGATYSQEVHHPDFKKFDQSTYGVNSTLTIQF